VWTLCLTTLGGDCSLSAGLLRQATYTTARLGMYSIINDWLVVRNKGNAAIPFYQVQACPPSPFPLACSTGEHRVV
jgi:hypothetical protein